MSMAGNHHQRARPEVVFAAQLVNHRRDESVTDFTVVERHQDNAFIAAFECDALDHEWRIDLLRRMLARRIASQPDRSVRSDVAGSEAGFKDGDSFRPSHRQQRSGQNCGTGCQQNRQDSEFSHVRGWYRLVLSSSLQHPHLINTILTRISPTAQRMTTKNRALEMLGAAGPGRHIMVA